jgi:hypothetical protein
MMKFLEGMWGFCSSNIIASLISLVVGFAFGSIIFAIRVYYIKKPLHAVIAFGASVFYWLILFLSLFYIFATPLDYKADVSAYLALMISLLAGLVSYFALAESNEYLNIR